MASPAQCLDEPYIRPHRQMHVSAAAVVQVTAAAHHDRPFNRQAELIIIKKQNKRDNRNRSYTLCFIFFSWWTCLIYKLHIWEMIGHRFAKKRKWKKIDGGAIKAYHPFFFVTWYTSSSPSGGIVVCCIDLAFRRFSSAYVMIGRGLLRRQVRSGQVGRQMARHIFDSLQ